MMKQVGGGGLSPKAGEKDHQTSQTTKPQGNMAGTTRLTDWPGSPYLEAAERIDTQEAASFLPIHLWATKTWRLPIALSSRLDEEIMTNNERIRALRRNGLTLRAIADKLGISIGAVRHRLQSRMPVVETGHSVVKNVLVLGVGGSSSCYLQPVSLPRLSFLEGAVA
jgi:hypothetical protein